MSIFKDERELIRKYFSPWLKDLNYKVRIGVRLRGLHKKLQTEDSLSTAELNIQHSLSPDIDILYWKRDYSSGPDLHAIEVKYYRYNKKNQIYPPMYDGIGEALLLGTFGVDYVHLWHYFDPEITDEEYNKHKQVLEKALNQINMVNYQCKQLSLADKTRYSDPDSLTLTEAIMPIVTELMLQGSFSSNSLRHDEDAVTIRNILKKAYRIV